MEKRKWHLKKKKTSQPCTRNSNTHTLKEQAWSEILYNNTDLPEIQILVKRHVVRQYTRLCIWSTLRTETKKSLFYDKKYTKYFRHVVVYTTQHLRSRFRNIHHQPMRLSSSWSQTRLSRTISAPGWSTSVILLRIPWVSEQGLVFHEGKQSLLTILHKTHLNKYIFKFWVKTFCAIDKFQIFKTLNKTSEFPKCWSLLPKSLC